MVLCLVKGERALGGREKLAVFSVGGGRELGGSKDTNYSGAVARGVWLGDVLIYYYGGA